MRNNNRKKIKKYLTIFFVISFFSILYFFPKFFSVTSSIIATPFYFIRDVVTGSTKSLVVYFESKKHLSQENNRLQEENNRLKSIALKASIFEDQITALEKEKNFSKETLKDYYIVSQVLSRPPFTPFDGLVIKFREGDFKKEDLVFAYGVPIGKISETFNSTAVVKLFSSPDNLSVVRIINDTDKTEVEAKGLGGGSFVSLVPKGIKIEKGASVILSSLPKYSFGQVAEVDFNEVETFEKVYFTYPFSIYTLDYVSVLRGSSEVLK